MENKHIPQRIEVPVPGGHLVATTYCGADYPSIDLFFVPSGETNGYQLCFAEVCPNEDPEHIRVGVYYADCDEVNAEYKFPIDKKEEE